MRILALGILLFCGLLAGCNNVPKTKGGAASTTLGAATEGTLAQSDNPETPSVQNQSRTERTVTYYVWGDGDWQKLPEQDAPQGTVVEHTVEQHSSTEIGSAQNVAKILKSAQNHGRALASVLLGLCLLFGAWKAFKATWPILGSVLALGGAVSIYTLNYWAGLGAVGVGLIIYVAYSLGEKTNPLSPLLPK